ncbi:MULTISPECIES: glycoside hydrolase 43 family protein [unclassified Duganella]|uniref:glycoside hydrolase family 43 protein n=1 Tax=unclassified Duganella TaxID=2636909 RepID=UPI00088035BF|nr:MULTISPECIES: glycoside hydrolase 43 family protein [unclassified Duganella]SDG93489.1 Beta-xylosidase [Duganella sp. OV458]SDJ48858.1 Beta-xylosidase [Duganella sp. OV510]
MKIRNVILALALIGSSAGAAEYANPVLYADYSDPDVIRVDNDYFMVASSFHFSPGIPILKSKDLVNWKIIGHVLPRLSFHPSYDMSPAYPLTDAVSKPVGDGLRYAGGVWAPAIRFHRGLFYVYWATPNEGIFMSSTGDPAGQWSEPVMVLAGAGYEDPCPFWDDDGKAYLIHSKVGAGPGILHAMSPDGKTLLDAGKTIIEDKVNLPVFEGPKLYKRNGYYYVFAPIGGVGTGPQAVLRSRSIEGPFEMHLALKPGNGLKGPHQGGYVETPSGQGWFMHFNSTGAFGRITHLQPVVWRDGWPIMGNETVPVSTHAYPDSTQQSRDYKLQDSDEFSSAQLGLQWSWNHNPDNARWSLTQRPGFMRIQASKSEYLVGARNTLTQILQGPQSEITTRIELGSMVDTQRAGLALFGVKVPWAGVVRDAGASYITYSNAGVETRGAKIDAAAVILRAVVREDQTVQFSYALNEQGPYTKVGPVTELAKFSWWKGSRPAVFTYVKGDVAGYIDVDWFRVVH